MSVSLVTGAGGFVGRHLCRLLESRPGEVRCVSSSAGIESWRGVRLQETREAVLAAALEGADCVYFCAAIAHRTLAAGDLGTLQEVNVECPVRWLRAAERVGVGRFVFLSSVKVLGDVSDRPLLPDDPYAPADAYARSKVAAERGLLDSARHSTAVALVRPPLVYGPGVGGNFQTLLRVAAGGLPLPLAAAQAPRSLLAVQNLVDLLVHLGRSFTPVCADAADGIWHASDGEDLGVAELLTVLRQAFGVPRRLFNVPAPLLRAAAAATGRAALYSRLFEPLQVDTSVTLGSLEGWTPPVSRDAALREAAAWFRR